MVMLSYALPILLAALLTPADATTTAKPLPAGPAVVGSARVSSGVARDSTASPSNLPISTTPEPGSELTISLLTFGPGDHPFFKFGHNAIWVHDAVSGLDPVYNFGTFGFESAWLILDFLKGKLMYWLSVDPLDITLAAYSYENRSVEAQQLNLTPAERLAMARALAKNARPENKYYKYDYYRDNCSTRIRDVIDVVTGGRLRAVSGAPAEMSWRDHTLRLTADNLPVYFGLHAAMGDYIDAPITVWDEMFLPAKLQETVRKMTGPGSDGREGFVRYEHVLVRADRPAPRAAPPHWLLKFAACGLAAGGFFVFLASKATRWRWARIGAAIVLGLYSLFFGLLGLIFFCLWAFTDHAVAFHNENILQFSPWALLVIPASLRLARGRLAALPVTRRVLTAVVAGSILGLVLKLTPWFDQKNYELIALLLPLWTLVLVGTLLWQRAARVSTCVSLGKKAS